MCTTYEMESTSPVVLAMAYGSKRCCEGYHDIGIRYVGPPQAVGADGTWDKNDGARDSLDDNPGLWVTVIEPLSSWENGIMSRFKRRKTGYPPSYKDVVRRSINGKTVQRPVQT